MRKTTPACRVTFLAVFLLAAGHWTSAATYYIAPNGNDAGPGTIDQPWLTVQVSVPRLVAGDTLCFRQGTHTFVGPVEIPTGASWDRPVALRTHPGETVLFKRADPARAARFDASSTSKYIIIEGAFVFDGVGPGLGLATYSRLKDAEVKNVVSTSAISGGGGHDEFINRDCSTTTWID